MTRLDRLRELVDEAFLVTTPVNVRYLVGFESTNAALLVDDARVRLFCDFRYAEAARGVEGVEFVEVERAIFRGIPRHVRGRVAFEASHLTYANWQTLRAAGLELVPTTGVVERLRAVKDDDELEKMRAAAEITSEAYARIALEPFVGGTEREIAFRFDQIVHELGGHGVAFATTVASGPNGATPHAHSTERTIERNETVVFDAGAVVDGYASDCTRTFVTGDVANELQRAYDVCRAGQQAGLDAVASGVTGRDADARARAVIAEAGFGDYFGHGLGHGVGLLVHEAPTLRPESEDTLADRNVVTVEPGIYFPAVGGIRIEDLVVVRDGAPEILTTFTKELVTVD